MKDKEIKVEKIKTVLDTSALIYLNDFRRFDEILTVQEVVDEAIDRITAIKLSTIDMKILEPEKASVEKIKEAARKTGDIDKLSKTDLKILALADQQSATIVSDDHSIQNVAEFMQIPYISTFSDKITKLITWKKYCSACDKYFSSGRVCRHCGGKLKHSPVILKDVK